MIVRNGAVTRFVLVRPEKITLALSVQDHGRDPNDGSTEVLRTMDPAAALAAYIGILTEDHDASIVRITPHRNLLARDAAGNHLCIHAMGRSNSSNARARELARYPPHLIRGSRPTADDERLLPVVPR